MKNTILIEPDQNFKPLSETGGYILLGSSCLMVLLLWYSIASHILNDLKPKNKRN